MDWNFNFSRFFFMINIILLFFRDVFGKENCSYYPFMPFSYDSYSVVCPFYCCPYKAPTSVKACCLILNKNTPLAVLIAVPICSVLGFCVIVAIGVVIIRMRQKRKRDQGVTLTSLDNPVITRINPPPARSATEPFSSATADSPPKYEQLNFDNAGFRRGSKDEQDKPNNKSNNLPYPDPDNQPNTNNIMPKPNL